jgi:hypothetical protein
MGIAYGTTTLHQATKGIVQDGLVLNLDAGVRGSVDGSSWKALTGGDLTLINGPSFSKENGGTLVLDGTNDYATCVVQNLSSTQISFCFMFKGTYANSVSRIQSNSSNYIVPYYGDGRFLINGTSSPPQDSSSIVEDGDWHHVACVYHKDNFFGMYVDGSLLSTSTSYAVNILSTEFTSKFFTYNGSSEFTNGKVPVAQIYNRALSAAEVLQNFNAVRHRFGI